jgi:hypothetical protein
MQRSWPLAKANGFILKMGYSGVGIFNWYYPSSPPQIHAPPGTTSNEGG